MERRKCLENKNSPFLRAIHLSFARHITRKGNMQNSLFQFTFIGNRKFLPALCPTAGQYLSAIGCLHPLTKTMYGLTTLTMRLKCTFHVPVILPF